MPSKIRHIEEDDQAALYQWVMLNGKRISHLSLLFHVPNGSKLSGASPEKRAIQGARLKRQGVRAGIWDNFWMRPIDSYCGLWIELKTKTGRLSEDQKIFGRAAVAQGYAAVVCIGWEAATRAINDYAYGRSLGLNQSLDKPWGFYS